MEKYIIFALVAASAFYLAFKVYKSWNRKSNCDTCGCSSKCSRECCDSKKNDEK